MAPYDIAIDETGYQALDKTVSLRTGMHSLTVRDAEGTESAAQTITIAAPITFGEATFTCSEDSRLLHSDVPNQWGHAPVRGRR